MGKQRNVVPVQILSGQSLSAEINVGQHRIIGVQMPAAWDAAGLALQALVRSPSGNPPAPVFGNVVDDAGAALPLATGPVADVYVAIADVKALRGLGRIKVRSGTNAVPVNQTATRDFFLVLVDD